MATSTTGTSLSTWSPGWHWKSRPSSSILRNLVLTLRRAQVIGSGSFLTSTFFPYFWWINVNSYKFKWNFGPKITWIHRGRGTARIFSFIVLFLHGRKLVQWIHVNSREPTGSTISHKFSFLGRWPQKTFSRSHKFMWISVPHVEWPSDWCYR